MLMFIIGCVAGVLLTVLTIRIILYIMDKGADAEDYLDYLHKKSTKKWANY